jgi:arsenate reductase (glutaredoxin)
VRIAEELGVEAEIVLYMKDPPTAETLAEIIAKLEDPPTALVRRDSNFAKLALADSDVETNEQIIAKLVKHKALLQRPIVVTPTTALVGRPKDRIVAALSPYATR